MRTTFAYEFYCRSSKTNKKGVAHIELSISINGERRIISLPFACKPEDFNKKSKTPLIKEYLRSIETNINGYIVALSQRNIPLTTDNMAECVRNGGIKEITYTIKDLFEEYNGIMEHADITLSHYRRYLHTTELFYRVVDNTRESKTLTNADILKFRTLVYSEYNASTAAGFMTRIRAYMRFAKDNGHTATNVAADVKTFKPARKEILYLTNEEYQRFKTKDMHTDRLNKVRDLWIAQANMGLSYCDMANLCKNDIKVQDGIYYISKERGKTGVQYTAVLLPDAIEILKKYNYHLPVISNQRYNSYLAECRDIAGIEKHFTTHTSRHQYATRLLAAGVPLSTIQHTLGHASIKMTESFYAALSQETILREVSERLY